MLVNPLFYPNFFEAPVYRYAVPKPKLVRRSESEDGFQFQIFKEDGDFNPFEFKLVKLGTSRGVLILFSEDDDFKVEFELDLSQIDAQNINFELNKYDDRILNLNIPKKQVHPLHSYFNCFADQLQQYQNAEKQRLEKQKELEKQKAVREQELEQERQRRIQEALAKQEKARKEKEERARKEKEERIRKQKEEQAQREREAKKQREAEYRLWKIRQEKLRKQKEEEERARREQMEKAQQQFAQLFQSFGPLFSPELCKPQASSQEAPAFPFPFPFPFTNGFNPYEAKSQQASNPESKAKDNKKPEPVRAPTPVKVRESPKPEPIVESPESGRATPDNDDTASIASEDPIEITLPSPSSPLDNNNLHKHPSLEEVEDEEFVMLRKKFGQ